MSLIQLSDLSFCYDGSTESIFEHVNLQLDTDWRLGLVGRNGRGKTTLLRLLMGELEYTGYISANVEFAYFPYAVKDTSITVKLLMESICPEIMEWMFLRELSLLDVEESVMERSFETLSGGEQTKVLLASLFLGENRFLLIDEPTNHLDLEGRAVLSRYLWKKQGYILVSHDRAFLDGCVDHVLSINKAGLELQKGNFSSWWLNKERQDAYELAQNEQLKKDIRRLEQTAREKAGWSSRAESEKWNGDCVDRGFAGHKAEKMMKRAKAIDRRVQAAADEKASLLKNLDVASELKLWPLRHHSPMLVQLSDVSVRYGETIACRNVSFSVNQGERIALRGRNGCGKSTVLKLIAAKQLDFTGAVKTTSDLKISFVPQDAAGLSGKLSDYAARLGADESLFKAILRKMGFRRELFDRDLSSYSAGQKKKVLLAGSLSERAHLYVWDEPLNYIDVLSRMQIENLLLEYRPTLLFVEHDKVFCDKIATKIVEL